ncbi:uncharacterized protein SCHCODRAFT_02577410 [Schizophyllum commune H4-8]|nr:uncharacterized protein SCHCODRAFT_02577410 [Schizophyllum commune H4-8]KAI5894389.1 hypothetical protein SCHCODRAFT_02577410 [Schizophyllum commune H4-8]
MERRGIIALPEELQILIFKHRLSPYCVIRENLVRDLSLVCRLWRDLIANEPQLWSAFELSLIHHGIPHSQNNVKLMQLRLHRSKDTRLRIRFNINDPTCKQLGLDIIALFKAHANRWQDIMFCGPATLAAALLSVDSSLPPSALSNLELTLMEDPQNVRLPHNFTISSLLVPYSAILNELSLNTRLVNLQTCLAILAQSPKLHRYTAVIHRESDFNVSPSVSQPTCRLEHLDLEIRNINPTQGTGDEHPLQVLARFLDAMILEDLTYLRIYWADSASPDEAGGRALFATILQCTRLRTLKIENLPLNQDAFAACIGTLTHLRHLSIQYPDHAFPSPLSRNFFRALCGHESSINLPQLEVLHISIHSEKVGKEDIYKLLERRMKAQGNPVLKDLFIHCDMDSRTCAAWREEISSTYPSLTVEISE